MAASPRDVLAGFVARLPEPQGQPLATFTVRERAPGSYVVERRLSGPGVSRCELGTETYEPLSDACAVIRFVSDAVSHFARQNPEFAVLINGSALPLRSIEAA
ncbi:hypothetical protein [Methylobacterium brachythecii]|uniref:Uncharacterized protein n=1 Tax=Methylobacterium brachythecii TaxID=1176177 RepID=A0A7W6ALZ8_9HYPH|nr:hypothetical protein [Methylobacterium brachythecii]MBB3905083.1 hypothetical protein [Methylobacterium brachythecii]GLS44409.1 hypothetical protein GCM10007884_23970 [Methylobacterium brachythecii]